MGRQCVVADIGGTNANFAIFEESQGTFRKLEQLDKASQRISDVHVPIARLLRKYPQVDICCLAVGGMVNASRTHANLSKLSFSVTTKKLSHEIGIPVMLLNDLEAIGYAIDLLEPDEFFCLTSKAKNLLQPKFDNTMCYLAVGTGLGKGIRTIDPKNNTPIILRSEGGYSDIPCKDTSELAMMTAIDHKRQWKTLPIYQSVLSGQGIIDVFDYFYEQKELPTENEKIIYDTEKNKAAKITQYCYQSSVCKQTMRKFVEIYARCAKNFVLESLATGGVLLAGGITAKNTQMFSEFEFLKEFVAHQHFGELLKSVPVFVIKDYNISLKGAANAAFNHQYLVPR